MRLSLNTILIALASSSVIMTDVFAVPLSKISHSGKQSKKLTRRQHPVGQDLAEVGDGLESIIEFAQGMALLVENFAIAAVNIGTEFGIDIGDSDSGDDGQDGGDPSGSDGSDGSGSTDGSGSGDAGDDGDDGDDGDAGDAGDAGASDGSDGTSGSTTNQRRDGFHRIF